MLVCEKINCFFVLVAFFACCSFVMDKVLAYCQLVREKKTNPVKYDVDDDHHEKSPS